MCLAPSRPYPIPVVGLDEFPPDVMVSRWSCSSDIDELTLYLDIGASEFHEDRTPRLFALVIRQRATEPELPEEGKVFPRRAAGMRVALVARDEMPVISQATVCRLSYASLPALA